MKGTILKFNVMISHESFWGYSVLGLSILSAITFIILGIVLDPMFFVLILTSLFLVFIGIVVVSDMCSDYEYYHFHIPYWYKRPDKIRNWEKEFEEVD